MNIPLPLFLVLFLVLVILGVLVYLKNNTVVSLNRELVSFKLREEELKKLQSLSQDLEKKNIEYKILLNGLEQRYADEKLLTVNQQQQIRTLENQSLNFKLNLAKSENNHLVLEEKLQDQKQMFDEMRANSLQEFERISNKVFEEKTTKFSKQSQSELNQLLSPLKENLKEFKKRVEDTYDKESKQRFSLEEKIKDLVNLNQRISKEAVNLTNALKGQSKVRGDWGEMILESVLQYSGLEKNRQYFIQESFKDVHGKVKQPDIVVRYPDDRCVVIDAKVSLVAYEKYVNSSSIDEQKIFLNQHIKSLKKHIEDLSSKQYEAFDNSLDFVFLFVPIEPAFLLALQHDNQLWNFAYSKRIVLMSPTNLIATLKVIVDVWSKDLQSTNAREISKRGALLYDKFVGFVDSLELLGDSLCKANEQYTNAFKKLSTGKGNLIIQAEDLKNLGLQPKKNLSNKYKD